MIKNMKSILWLAPALFSCGTINGPNSGVSNSDYGCIEECAMVAYKSSNKCRLDYAHDTDKQTDCTLGLTAENDRCQGECFGHL